MYTIGLNISHNCSACAIKENEVVCAIAGERISRIKYFFEYGDSKKAIYYLISRLGISPESIDSIGINYGDYVPDIANKDELGYFIDYKLENHLIKARFFNHHLSHASSAYYSSGFDECLIMVSDARGSSEKNGEPLSQKIRAFDDSAKTETISFYIADKKRLELVKKYFYPLSLGELYSLITAYLGFNRHSDNFLMDFNEGKTMGLAPYGKSFFSGESLIFLSRDGFGFNEEYIDCSGKYLRLKDAFYMKFGKERKPGEKIKYGHKLAAFVVQNDLEKVCHYLIELQLYSHNMKNIAFSGGTFLNCVMNGNLKNVLQCEGFYVFPAADDSGLAVGNAYLSYLSSSRSTAFGMNSPSILST